MALNTNWRPQNSFVLSSITVWNSVGIMGKDEDINGFSSVGISLHK